MRGWAWLGGLGIACAVTACLHEYHLAVNVGQSLAGSLYACQTLQAADRLQRGMVVYYLPPMRVQATLRRIAPGADLRLGWLKEIAAVGGDDVCWDEEHILVNHQVKGTLPLLADYPLSVPSGTCHILREEEVLPMGTAARSFDGRYTGPLMRQEIADVCIALF
jgi:type IV secretory pathway protease TraF